MTNDHKSSTNDLKRLTNLDYHNTPKSSTALILDNIRSAINIGSVFRTADAFLVNKILLCGICATPPNKEILKSALGATETVSWEYHKDAVELVLKLKDEGYMIIAVEQTSNSVQLTDFEIKKAQKIALILGNEVSGVSDELIKICDMCLEIPQFGTKHSLNVAVAAGIVIWDLYQKSYLQKGPATTE